MDLFRPFSLITPTLDGDVLDALVRARYALTSGQISRMCEKQSVSGVRKVLERLARVGVVEKQKCDHIYLYSLNREHLLTSHLEAIASLRDAWLWALIRAIEEWEVEPEFACVYGRAATRVRKARYGAEVPEQCGAQDSMNRAAEDPEQCGAQNSMNRATDNPVNCGAADPVNLAAEAPEQCGTHTPVNRAVEEPIELLFVMPVAADQELCEALVRRLCKDSAEMLGTKTTALIHYADDLTALKTDTGFLLRIIDAHERLAGRENFPWAVYRNLYVP